MLKADCKESDAHGKIIEDLLEDRNFVVLNTGEPTYQHHTGDRSHLDLSFISDSLALKCSWTVLNNTMGSDHSPLHNSTPVLHTYAQPRFKLDKADWDNFKEHCRTLVSHHHCPDDVTVNEHVDQITSGIIKAAETTTTHVGGSVA